MAEIARASADRIICRKIGQVNEAKWPGNPKGPQLAEAARFASPNISSARGARGPTATAIQNHVRGDLLRSRAIAPASGIDPIEMMTKSQKPMAISGTMRHDSIKAARGPALRKM
ncbi:hypothetical protein [Bradyrhizobium sp. CCBAU 53340]|uniref:hypothetical protein n=1 Tax=Bradyrhizobium sp. CCBAU 53340 TaxID=1325112 RepID=UPI00188AF7E3|nr:hypothetical protein [Bradyrhizobium sp. CCBAU 53340]